VRNIPSLFYDEDWEYLGRFSPHNI